MKNSFIVLVVGLLLTIPMQANGDLIINLSGTQGSNVVNWEATGSVTAIATTALPSQSVGAAPIGGLWNTGFDNNLGNLILNTAANDLNRPLNGGGISYQINSTEFMNIQTLDLGASTTANGDDIEPDPIGTANNYPALIGGDIVSWTGNGTFTLSSATYDTFFVQGTSGSKAIDGGNYVVNIAVAAVPEPTTIAMFGMAMFCLAGRRRKT